MSWILETDDTVPAVIKCMSINPNLMAAVQNLGANASFGSSALTQGTTSPTLVAATGIGIRTD